jgi:uncharacterized protein involved in outer membrane biogenesis
LLSGTVSVERVVLDRPQIEYTETTTSTASASKEKSSAEEKTTSSPEDESVESGLSLEISEIAIKDGTVVMRTEDSSGGSTAKINGLNMTFHDISYDAHTRPPVHGFSADGELDIAELTFDTLTIRDATGQLSVAEGRFEMKPLRFSMDEGEFTAEMQIDFNPTPFTYTLEAQGDPLDFNAMAKAADGGFGPGKLQLQAKGVGTDSKDVKGTGSLTLAEGEFPQIPVLSQVDEKLGKTVLVGAPYKATELKFQLANNIVTIAPFPFETEGAKVELEGWVNIEGPLDLDFAMGVVREGIAIEGVGENVLNILTDDEGWVMIPISVSGTSEEPRVRPDTNALLAQAGHGTKRLVQEKATDAILGFIKKKKQ